MSINTIAIEAAAITDKTAKPSSEDDKVAALTKYIPTESLTLYVAGASSQAALASVLPFITPRLLYWSFLALTPVIVLALFFRKLKVTDRHLMLLTRWPWWKMVAATIAFAVWALAVPGNPFIPPTNASGGVAAAFGALVVSTFLTIVEPLCERAS